MSSTNRIIPRALLPAKVVAFITLAFSAWSCDNVDQLDQSGDLVLSYSLSSEDMTCSQAGIHTVRAVLGQSAYTAEVDCDKGELTIADVEPGTYDLAVYGVNGEGVSSMDSLADGLMPVEVLPGEIVKLAKPIVLTDAPVRLHLRWKLGWGSCSSVGIFRFRIEAFNLDGSEEILETSLFCWQSGSAPDFYREAPDPLRSLTDPDLAMVQITPLDHSGSEVGTLGPVVFDEFVNPGPGEAVEMSIECSIHGCDFPSECI